MEKLLSKINPLGWMFIMASVSLAIKYFISGIPFSYYTVYFHELSHGLLASWTGGEIERIELTLNAAGVCYYRGGIQTLIAFSGYGFTSVFGALMFILGLSVQRGKRSILYWGSFLLMFAMFAVGFIHIRDLVTGLILSGLIGCMAIALYWPKYGHLFMKFIGVFMMIDTFSKANYLFQYSESGDHYSLWQLTGIPMTAWIITWFVVSGAMFLLTTRMLYKIGKRKET